jgi:hypothetical protein
MTDPILNAVKEILRTRNALIEQACESALAGGKDGVMVIESDNLFEATFSVAVSPLVPYGHLFRFPSRDAVDLWINHGCPK